MISWLINNKEWVFSGIGVLILSSVIGFFMRQKAGTVQRQKSGKNSINIQSAGTINIGNNYRGDKDAGN